MRSDQMFYNEMWDMNLYVYNYFIIIYIYCRHNGIRAVIHKIKTSR